MTIPNAIPRVVLLLVALSAALTGARGQQPGTLRWSLGLGGICQSATSPAIGADGTIYVTTDSGPLYAVNPDGTVRWVLRTNMTSLNYPWSSPVIGDDGTIYVSARNDSPLRTLLLAANPDGTWKWMNPSNSCGEAPISIANDGAIIVGRSDLLCLNTDGSRRWSFATIDYDTEPTAIARDGTIFFGAYHAYIYSITPSGAELWRRPGPNLTLFNFSPSVGEDGTLYGCVGYGFCSISPQGATNWLFPTQSRLANSSAVGPDGTIYFGSDEGLYAVSPAGTLRWSYRERVRSCPALAADGTIYFNAGSLYAVNTNGNLLWRFNANVLSGINQGSSPAIGADGTIYIISVTNLVAVHGRAPLANSPWPMYRRDARHTGRAGGAATQAPRLSLVVSPSEVSLRAQCEWGRSFRTEFSADLKHWSTVTNFTGSMQPHLFTWPVEPGSPSGFYRIVSP